MERRANGFDPASGQSLSLLHIFSRLFKRTNSNPDGLPRNGREQRLLTEDRGKPSWDPLLFFTCAPDDRKAAPKVALDLWLQRAVLSVYMIQTTRKAPVFFLSRGIRCPGERQRSFRYIDRKQSGGGNWAQLARQWGVTSQRGGRKSGGGQRLDAKYIYIALNNMA